MRTAVLAILLLVSAADHCCRAEPPRAAMQALLAAYAPQPQGYPEGKTWARPDTSVPFRWHGYHDGAIDRCEDAKMRLHVEPYNPLEGEGVSVERSSAVKWTFVGEHATKGERSLRADFPTAAIQAGKAVVNIKGIAGPPSFLVPPPLSHPATASCYLPHYRWIKLDVWNASAGDVRIRASGVPFVLPPGGCTLAVKAVDAVERQYQGAFNSLPIEVAAPAQDVTLYLDNVRMEQETPATIGRAGRLFQFPGQETSRTSNPVLWPGLTPIEANTLYTPERGFGWTAPAKTRLNRGLSFRSFENGLIWGWVTADEAPLQIDVPNGRWRIALFASPQRGLIWARGAEVKVQGKAQRLYAPRTPAQVRQLALGGEAIDYRPGLCIWEQLVRPAFYPAAELLEAEVTDGRLLLQVPAAVAVRALFVFPVEEQAAALRELGRFNYLLAESWDVSHPWVRAGHAERVRYIGLHEEMLHPERIPDRLRALDLHARDFERGFVLFQRGLTEAVYSDTIPTPEEAAVARLEGFAVPGMRECLTLGILPLAARAGLSLAVTDLATADGKSTIPADRIDVRFARMHQKVLTFGHHNHDYNWQEGYLVRRPRLDLHPGAARRAYLDIDVPADAAAGVYRGTATLAGPDGTALARVPIVLEVLPIRLEDPPVFFAGSWFHPRLKDYGLNTFRTDHAEAVKHGLRGYVAPGPWARLVDRENVYRSDPAVRKELEALVQAARAGKGPRAFLGGWPPGTHANPKAEQISRAFFEALRKDLPDLDLLSQTAPAWYHGGPGLFQLPHEWDLFHTHVGTLRAARVQELEAAHAAGREFWFLDGLRQSKEQAARFTFGFWLWRLGARGRYTSLAAALQYGGGTARETHALDPYWTLLDVTGFNIDRALHESATEGVLNPWRDLLLIRAGIDDHRFIHTLDRRLAQAEAARAADPAIAAARKWRDDLSRSLSLDLTTYYESRTGAYAENWHVRPGNPWNGRRFDQVRRQAAEHIRAIDRILRPGAGAPG